MKFSGGSLGLLIPKREEGLSPWGTYQSLRASGYYPSRTSQFHRCREGAPLPATAPVTDRSLSHFFSNRLLNTYLVPAVG